MPEKVIFFDLDGTLLGMDEPAFIRKYFGLLCAYMAERGYDPEKYSNMLYAGMKAMSANDGTVSNEIRFRNVFVQMFGEESRKDRLILNDFYLNVFPEVRETLWQNAGVPEMIASLKQREFRLILATNPLLPRPATEFRVRTAGLDPKDFEWITVYENSSYCKPNPEYYLEICRKLEICPEDVLMIGNDAEEDGNARLAGMSVYLVTDQLISRKQTDLNLFEHGTRNDLYRYLR